ncbi:MAG TPA: 3'-5' exonuclease [Burkholderiaceae bacterium]|nr:3'-5' exonuclease [Burkholderiaceae bacterium]
MSAASWLSRLVARGVRAPADARRWVVLDVESSGLDPARDRLLAIAAIGVHLADDRAQIELADSFEVVLRQPEHDVSADKANILLHGIGVGAQRDGVAPAEALDAFSRFVAQAPLLGFHVGFDRALIVRACAQADRPAPRNRWLDLEPLAAVLHAQVKASALDDWLAHFHIRCVRRHLAAADALATAELLLHLWPLLRAERATDIDAAIALAGRRRWLAGA